MSVYKKLLSCVGTGVLGLVIVAGIANGASAHEYGHCHQVLVTVYETREVAVQVPVVRYDDCGRPYTVLRTRYKTVSVPVQKLVTVCD